MRRRALLTLLAAAGLGLLLSGVAAAAPAREYQIQYSPVGNGGLSQMIVTVVADPAASLPATVSVPIPAGSMVLWSGELLGGDAADDPLREATVERIGDMDVYTFTLEQTLIGQVEATVGEPTIVNDVVQSDLTWTNPGEAVPVSLSVVVEPGAQDIRFNGSPPDGKPQVNEVGESLYPIGSQNVAAGAALTVSTEWTRNGGGEGGGSSTLLSIVGTLLVIIVVVLVLVIVRQRRRIDEGPAASDGP